MYEDETMSLYRMEIGEESWRCVVEIRDISRFNDAIDEVRDPAIVWKSIMGCGSR